MKSNLVDGDDSQIILISSLKVHFDGITELAFNAMKKTSVSGLLIVTLG